MTKLSQMTLSAVMTGYCLRSFTNFYNTQYGNCYTFNSGWNASEELITAYRAGPQYGE